MKASEGSLKILTQQENLKKFLVDKGFVSAGTSDLRSQPNAAPKYIIKIDKDFIYLADYVIGQTIQNLRVNPRISLSTIDMKTLEGWQINGSTKIITKGVEYKRLSKAMIKQEARHTAKRIIEDVNGTQKYDFYQVLFPEKAVFIRVKCEKITKISIAGKLQAEVVEKSE